MSTSPTPEKAPKWSVQLADSYYVNSVGISDDASRVVGGTYYHQYGHSSGSPSEGLFGIYCYDSNGNQLWFDDYEGYEGVYAAGISGNAQVAAAGGWFASGQGLLRAYDASTGKKLLDYKQAKHRVSTLGLAADGSVLVAAAEQIYVFFRGPGSFSSSPATIPFGSANAPTTVVAIHPTGSWLAACDQQGNVCVATIMNSAIQQTYTWTAPAAIPFLSVAIAAASEYFAVGGGDVVYLFSLSSMSAGTGPIASYATPAGGTTKDVRWVAISGDGSFVTAVENQGLSKTGLLLGLSASGGGLVRAWEDTLSHNPNSTSIDSDGLYVTAADGYPDNAPGTFYLFDARSGRRLWQSATDNMSWPMVISVNGAGIAAGSDNGSLYYFEP